MDTYENNTFQLPQLLELTSRLSTASTSKSTIGDNTQTFVETFFCGNSIASNQTKPNLLVNKYTSPQVYALTDILQLCDKQGTQSLNIPNYNQNNTMQSVESNNLPVIIPNLYWATMQSENLSHEVEKGTENKKEDSTMQNSQAQPEQPNNMAELFQKLQATALPLTVQQLLKMQNEQAKKEKSEDEKLEQTQNNILNIPTVPVFRNTQNQLQNESNILVNSNQIMTNINLNNCNLNLENQQQNENSLENVKVEQQIQEQSEKSKRKIKFRAKIGEIKVSAAMDGTTLYCCPECTLGFFNKTEAEQHLQTHIQERKYQCKVCGAMLKRKEHLDQHMRGHSDERPFKCSFCQKAFKRNEHLTRHHTIHSGDRNFTCHLCNKTFSRKDHLTKHFTTHSKDKKKKEKKTSSEVPKQEVNFVLKQDPTNLYQYFQNLQRDPSLINTFCSPKEQAVKETNVLQQQAVNMNEILPQNIRYLMPSSS